MKLLWLFFALPAVFGKPGFGNSYLKDAYLCRPWTCINTKLGLPDSLPPRDLAEASYRRVLPQGPWQEVLGQVLDNCYENRTRRYTNTCPGQALMHCVLDQMINNCPEEHMRKDDACSSVTTLAGFKDMFTQSVYHNLEKNLPTEVRPTYFLKNYFHLKCCNLPELFSSTELKECGFESFLKNYTHESLHANDNLMVRSVQDRGEVIKAVSLNQMSTPAPLEQSVQDNGDFIQAVSLNRMTTPTPSAPPAMDALDCCDMTGFIEPSWRTECGFHVNWKGGERLVIANYTTTTEAPVTTTTARPDSPKDLMYLPHSCPQESCVFRKLGIIDESGTVSFGAFQKLLYNFTDEHPSWLKAASKISRTCLLGSGGRYYQADCEINRVLACTLDVLTENCPYSMKSNNSCKHNRQKRVCQISSSKFGPKHRREICMLPPLVHLGDLAACGLETLYKPEYVMRAPEPKRHAWSSLNLCVDQTSSTTCLMNKMGILNKYKFLDYFKMKDRIRQFTSNQSEWSALREIYMSAFINIPMYGEHCSSQKKLLNVVDSMLMSCPVSKRVNSPQCAQLFQDITNSTLKDHEDATKDKIDQMTKHHQHVVFQRPRKYHRFDPVIRRPRPPKRYQTPLFYGFVDKKDSPKVDIMHIKPALNKDRTLVLAPVYLREPNLSLARPFHRDPMLRSNLVISPSRLHQLGYTTPSTFITTES